MPRKSERELKRAIEDLSADGGTAREWVDRYLERSIADYGFEVEFPSPSDEGAPSGSSDPDRVPVKESEDRYVFLVPRSDVPDWIDREDLPVEA